MTGPVYRAVGWTFTVQADAPVVARTVRRVLVDLEHDGPADHAYLLRSPTALRPGQLLLDDRVLTTSVDEALLYRTLLWHVNRGVVEAGADHVLLHASAAADHAGRTVVLAAPMESGKTTLVAGLVRAGLRYLTDEATALDPATGLVTAYPKPLSVDEGSWPVLPDLEPLPDPEVAHLRAEQWQVPASSFGAVAAHGRPAVIVLPAYRDRAATALTPVPRAEALVELLHSSFAPERRPERDFTALAGLVRTCDCYRLVSGDLDEAVDAVAGALGRAPGHSS